MQRLGQFLCYVRIEIIPSIKIIRRIIFQRFPRDTISVSMLKKKFETLGRAFSNGMIFVN